MTPTHRSRTIAALAAVWLAVQALLWYTYGTFTALEAEKYTRAAQYLLQHGAFPERKYVFYADTPLLIAASLRLGLGYHGAVSFQILLSGLAMVAFFRLMEKITGHFRLAAGTTLALILFFPFQSWNVYLYTESVFFSALILLLYALHRLSERIDAGRVTFALAALLLTITARPFGMLFIPAVLVYGFCLLPRRRRPVALALSLAGLGFLYYALNRAFSGSVDWNALQPNVQGSIICDMPDPRYQQPLALRTGGNPVDQLVYYIAHNPAHYARLSLLRLKAFCWPLRSWYSNAHNLFLAVATVLLYAGAALGSGMLRRRVRPAFFWFVVTALAGYTVAITFQCDDYHNRFWLALIPMLILAAGCAWLRRTEPAR